MADQDNSLFRELDEEMRREQLLKIWKRYGTYIIAVAAAIPLGVGGYQVYLQSAKSAIETAGAAYEAAGQLITSGKSDEARAALEKIAKTGPNGYAMLAELRLASATAKAGKVDEAVALYDALGKDRFGDKLLADFARLQAASLRLDAADWTEMQNRLIELTDNANPWRFQARELMGLAAFKHGELEQARKFNLLLLGQTKVPPAMLERVNVMMAAITATELAAGQAVPAAPAAAPKPPAADAQKIPEPKAAEDAKNAKTK